MTQDKTFKWKCRHWLGAGALLAVCGLGMVSCNRYDLDKTSPEGWGQSIYDFMAEEGSYSNMTRLIDDLGLHDVLAKTGSVTLFAADDDAFQRFYDSDNSWKVKRYEDLTLAQKKLLLKGAMLENSLQMQALSSTKGDEVNGPTEGECMRRLSRIETLDTVPVILAKDMPQNNYWKRHRDNGSIVCLEDNSNTPMLLFVEKQLVNNQITNDDVDFLFNYKTQRKTGDVSVNGHAVVEGNIRCSNGFIHRVDEVMVPLQNMADIIAKNPNTKIFNRLLERFCAPFPCSENIARNYFGASYNPSTDTVYQKRFFSNFSQGGQLYTDPNGIDIIKVEEGGTVPDPDKRLLKFDPGWNAYYQKGSPDADVALQRDMAVMMVPTDDIMDAYWKGEGKMLSDVYDSWDDVPDDVIAPLISNNMLSSFLLSVPSKFSNILNDANDPMGVEKSAISSVQLACNGAIYYTKKVYTPTSYVSVCYPTVVNETMKIMHWAIENTQYDAFLNSLNSTYSFFIPTNNALLEYIDPVSYGQKNTKIFRFRWEDGTVKARYWDYDVATGTIIGDESDYKDADYGMITNRLRNILESHIVVGNLDPAHKYYRSKNNTVIYVDNLNAGENGMTVSGGWQLEHGISLPVTKIYDQTINNTGNGKAYILDGAPIMGTSKSVYDIIENRDNFKLFASYLNASDVLKGTIGNSVCGSKNIGLFNTYHYTVYVPTDEAVQKLIDTNKLPRLLGEGEEDLRTDEQRMADSTKIARFVRVHIQDNAIYLNSNDASGEYETSYLIEKKVGNQTVRGFARLNVENAGTALTVTQKDAKGNVTNTAHVITSNPANYNIPATEYQLAVPSMANPDIDTATGINTSSSAVIHLIDNALIPPTE